MHGAQCAAYALSAEKCVGERRPAHVLWLPRLLPAAVRLENPVEWAIQQGLHAHIGKLTAIAEA
eukprot:13695222-Alexandrium_andersonii.AAC.1